MSLTGVSILTSKSAVGLGLKLDKVSAVDLLASVIVLAKVNTTDGEKADWVLLLKKALTRA